MKLFFSPDQLTHNPQKEIPDGKLVDAVEVPKRAEMVFHALWALPAMRVAISDRFWPGTD